MSLLFTTSAGEWRAGREKGELREGKEEGKGGRGELTYSNTQTCVHVHVYYLLLFVNGPKPLLGGCIPSSTFTSLRKGRGGEGRGGEGEGRGGENIKTWYMARVVLDQHTGVSSYCKRFKI